MDMIYLCIDSQVIEHNEDASQCRQSVPVWTLRISAEVLIQGLS